MCMVERNRRGMESRKSWIGAYMRDNEREGGLMVTQP